VIIEPHDHDWTERVLEAARRVQSVACCTRSHTRTSTGPSSSLSRPRIS
jgi:hypothetical protein